MKIIQKLWPVFVLAGLSCFQTLRAQQITLSGELQMDTVYSEIFLEDFSRTPRVKASSPVDAEGRFLIRYPLKELNFFKLKLDDNNFLVIITLPGETIHISARASALGDEPVITGSPHSLLLRELGKQVAPLDRSVDSILQDERSYVETDTAGRKLTPIAGLALEKFDAQRKEVIRQFIMAHPDSPACLFYSNRLPLTGFFDAYILLNDSLYAQYPENPYVRELYYAVTAQRYIQPGLVAPDIRLPDTSGDTVALSSLRGKVVLVDFWAAWCGPCRKENPNIVEAYRKYHESGFEVYGVSLDNNRESWIKGIQSDSLSWTQVSDLKKWDSETAMRYAVRAIPFSLLINRDGTIIARELRGPELFAKLEEIFGY